MKEQQCSTDSEDHNGDHPILVDLKQRYKKNIIKLEQDNKNVLMIQDIMHQL